MVTPRLKIVVAEAVNDKGLHGPLHFYFSVNRDTAGNLRKQTETLTTRLMPSCLSAPPLHSAFDTYGPHGYGLDP
jgi:hypothetical protein